MAGVPTGLAGTIVSPTRIDLSWADAAGATGYDLSDNDVVIATDVSSPWSHTGLAIGSSHTYKVRSREAATFSLGITQPTTSNTGYLGDEDDLTADSGIKYLASDTVYENKLLSGRIVCQGHDITIRNCVIEMQSSASTINAIVSWVSGNTGILIQNVTIRCAEENRSYFIGAGIHGSGFTAERVKISGTTDGIMLAGVNQRSYGYVYGCHISDMPHYDYDGGAHVDGSHNDAIQIEGNMTDVIVRGNTLGTGYTSCVIVTQNLGSYDAGPWFDSNWFEIDDASFGTMLNLAKTSMTSYAGFKVTGNRFPTGTSPARMFILATYLSAMSSAGGITATGAGKNVYDNGTSPVTVYNGSSNTTSY